MSAADTYITMIDTASAQRARIHGELTPGERYQDISNVRRLRSDPRRAFNANMEILAGFIEPTDVLLDVGGGAGRIGLPLALRCRELINVDPSLTMIREFVECAAQAGIDNVRCIQGDWLEVPTLTADVVLTVHVTYFVRDIVPFIQKLSAAAGIAVISPKTADGASSIFQCERPRIKPWPCTLHPNAAMERVFDWSFVIIGP